MQSESSPRSRIRSVVVQEVEKLTWRKLALCALVIGAASAPTLALSRDKAWMHYIAQNTPTEFMGYLEWDDTDGSVPRPGPMPVVLLLWIAVGLDAASSLSPLLLMTYAGYRAVCGLHGWTPPSRIRLAFALSLLLRLSSISLTILIIHSVESRWRGYAAWVDKELGWKLAVSSVVLSLVVCLFLFVLVTPNVWASAHGDVNSMPVSVQAPEDMEGGTGKGKSMGIKNPMGGSLRGGRDGGLASPTGVFLQGVASPVAERANARVSSPNVHISGRFHAKKGASGSPASKD